MELPKFSARKIAIGAATFVALSTGAGQVESQGNPIIHGAHKIVDMYGRDITDRSVRLTYPKNIEPVFDNKIVPLASADQRFTPTSVLINSGTWPASAAFADFNNDGLTDAMVANESYFSDENDNRAIVYEKLPDGSYIERYRQSFFQVDPNDSVSGYFNADLNPDLAVSTRGGIEFFFGDGHFGFRHTIEPAGHDPYGIDKFNFSQGIGLAVTNWNSDFSTALSIRADKPIKRTDYEAPGAGWNKIAAGDVTGDNKKDLIEMWGQGFNPAFSVLPGDGRGGFGTRVDYDGNDLGLPDWWCCPEGIAVGDATGDGLDDVVIGYGGNDAKLAVIAQQPDGSLRLNQVIPTHTSSESVDLGDVDCDGDKDVVTTNSGAAAFTVHLQENGKLGPAIAHRSTGFSHIGPGGAGLAKIDGDNQLDYWVADYNSNSIMWARQLACPQGRPSPTPEPKELPWWISNIYLPNSMLRFQPNL